MLMGEREKPSVRVRRQVRSEGASLKSGPNSPEKGWEARLSDAANS